MVPVEVEFATVQPTGPSSFVGNVCLPYLQAAQNEDGGWGFHPGSQSRVEATCWALVALLEIEPSNQKQQAGFRYLRLTQLPDGSWPSSAGQVAGSWVTSLASLVLLTDSESREAAAAGLRWTCEDWPRGINFIGRMTRRFSSRKEVVSQNESLRGWGWTPRTASWVEPTAFALIALEQASRELLPPGADRRLQLAKAFLYDRMCPGGGWNCGNPMVYGVPGDPLVEPTVWGLLALRNEPSRPEKLSSLQWLEKNLLRILGAQSAALAKICWEAYGREWPAGAPRLEELYAKNEFLDSVPVTAWACLALGPRPGWLRAATREEPR
jgi:hypothetical protein